MNRKAISLFSGGLDSTLAAKLILDQGIEVIGLHYTSCFASKSDKERGLQAVRTANELGMRLIVKEKGDDYIEVIKHPRYGYGKNMNPCIDCRIFMLQQTRLVMDSEGASFLVTGEVVGQRPMSQKRHTIELIERRSGLDGLIVRPLSAKLLPPTKPELEGVIDRERLYGVSGRSRETQYELVSQFGISEFASPAGGCLLTDPIFGRKLKDLMASGIDFTPGDIELLTLGRYLRFGSDTMVIVGRNHDENERLEGLWKTPNTLFTPVDFKGPRAVLKGPLTPETIQRVGNVLAHYSKHEGPTVRIRTDDGTPAEHEIVREEIDVEQFMVSLPWESTGNTPEKNGKE